MKDYLQLEPKKLKKTTDDMTKAEVIDLYGRAYEEAYAKQHVGGGLIAAGTVAGFSIGEIFGYLIKLWGASSLPMAGLVKDWYPGLRTVPHLLAAAIMLVAGRNLETRKQIVSYAGGLGLGTAALARLHDWFEHNGDMSADAEAVMAARLEAAEAKLKAAGLS